MNNTTALQGVSVGGVDISGLYYDEAKQATTSVETELISKISVSFTVETQTFDFTGEQIGAVTDIEDALKQALEYGNTGTLEERKAAILNAKENGVNFPVSVSVKRETVAAAILPLKATLDALPVDATFQFSPWGFTLDGQPYVEDEDAMILASSKLKMWERPDLIRLTEEEMPNKLRYQYWQNDHYEEDYTPADASVARFLYTEGTPGRSVDLESVADSIVNQVTTGAYTVITAPVTPIEPAVTAETLKKNTGLVASWTSSYSEHDSSSRVWNVAKLSGIINGVIIEPGVEWSVNTEAGDRTKASGWKEADGIVNGGYVPQYGGGVCQISSTLYNAAIRTNMNITDSTHHSIRSGYIPYGLDATISSGSPDLKMKNDFECPVYIISYMNPVDKTVTVEFYGPTVVDPEFGDVILNFSFKSGGTFGDPIMTFVYGKTKDPKGNDIPAGGTYVYAEMRKGSKVYTYIHKLSLDGVELYKGTFHDYTWRAINGITWVNGTEPTPTPTPGEPTPTPTATETPASTSEPPATSPSAS